MPDAIEAVAEVLQRLNGFEPLPWADTAGVAREFWLGQARDVVRALRQCGLVHLPAVVALADGLPEADRLPAYAELAGLCATDGAALALARQVADAVGALFGGEDPRGVAEALRGALSSFHLRRPGGPAYEWVLASRG